MGKKWYSYFVSVDQPPQGASASTEPAAEVPSAAQTVAEIAATIAVEPKFAVPVNNPTSFDEIYHAAEIAVPGHGYTIFKVADMLQSPHLRGLPAEVKRSSILVALEAAGVKIEQVIEDAVRRDRALDTYERVLEKGAADLEARKTEENRRIESEMERVVADYRARIQANNDEVAKEKERFYGWRLQKQQEEKRIADAVAPFVSENPITTGAPAAPAKAQDS